LESLATVCNHCRRARNRGLFAGDSSGRKASKAWRRDAIVGYNGQMARRLQFTLRSLLILTLLVSLPLGWMAFRRAQVQRRWKRYHALKTLGGEIDLHFANRGERLEGDGADDSPPWHIIAVRLPKSRITNAELALVESLSTLKELDLSGTKISDEGLARLGRLDRLEQLDLRDTRTTETGVSQLKKLLPNCEILH
jgi:hypothetical protein